MGKILYVGDNIDQIKSGADSVNKRNITVLNSIFQTSEIIIKPLSENTIKDKLFFYVGGLNQKIEKEILDILDKDDCIGYVFISHSLLGRLAKSIKKRFGGKIKIITFFHNVERHYAKEFMKSDGVKHFPFYLWASYNERYALKFSDVKIVLNERDNLELEKYYQKKANLILPATYKDIFENQKSNEAHPVIDYLFVGTAFFANLEAIRWFIKNVMPNVSGSLTIVGKEMDTYKDEFENERIKVFGFVNDLSKYYYESKVVIAPIFSGGGMKTKIAEALMYGKLILGTTEAFEGYVNNQAAMILCNTADEYIKILNSEEFKNKSLFNSASRDCFINNYENNITLTKFQSIFND